MGALPGSPRLAVGLASLGVAMSMLALIVGLFAEGPGVAGPSIGLALAVGVWWALHRLCKLGSRRAERAALAGVLVLAVAPLLHSLLGPVTSMPAVFALAGAFALTPRPSRERAVMPRRPSTWLAAGALAWSVLLVLSAFALPLYRGSSTSWPGGSVETSATMVEVNGPSVLIPMAIPAVLCGLAWLLIHVGARRGSRWPYRGAWLAAWVLAVFAFITGFSIGFLLFPAAIALLLAVGRAESGA